MIRYAAAIAVALCLIPSTVGAQDIVFTVKATPANVHKSPSTGSAVIGKAPHGARLEVTRELGSWVKVVWPRGGDGVGYVHVTTGVIARAAATARTSAAAASAPARPAIGSVAPPAVVAPAPRSDAGGQPPESPRAVYIKPPTHIVGVGGQMNGPDLGFGASARAWSRERVGIQIAASRSVVADPSGRVTSSDLAPSVLYALRDRVTDYWWMRPYLGTGAILQHQTVAAGTPAIAEPVSDNRLGFQAFGGGEVTFAGMPRLALSADLGYRWVSTAFAGLDRGGVDLSVSMHWYLR